MEGADYVRELLASGMTQADIAKETDIPQPTISRISRGLPKDVPSRRSRKLQALWELRVAGKERASGAGTQDLGRPALPQPDHGKAG